MICGLTKIAGMTKVIGNQHQKMISLHGLNRTVTLILKKHWWKQCKIQTLMNSNLLKILSWTTAQMVLRINWQNLVKMTRLSNGLVTNAGSIHLKFYLKLWRTQPSTWMLWSNYRPSSFKSTALWITKTVSRHSYSGQIATVFKALTSPTSPILSTLRRVSWRKIALL